MNETAIDAAQWRRKTAIWCALTLINGGTIGLIVGFYYATLSHTPDAIRAVRSNTPAFKLLATRILANELERDEQSGSYFIPEELERLGVSAVNKSEGMVIFSFATFVTDPCEYIVYLPEAYFDSEKWVKDGGSHLFFECRVFDDEWCYIINYC
jgi:hypothetical protein